MADRRGCHRAHDARSGQAWTWTEQDAIDIRKKTHFTSPSASKKVELDPARMLNPAGVLVTKSAICLISLPDSFAPMMFGCAARRDTAAVMRFTPVTAVKL